MNTTKILILTGAVALMVGVCLPVVGDSESSASMWATGNTTGVGWLVLGGLIAGGLALANRARYAVWPALATLAGLVYTFLGMQSDLARFNADQPLPEHVAHLQWPGWAVLAIGVLLIMIASFRVITGSEDLEDESL
jgi:hypothetical protein